MTQKHDESGIFDIYITSDAVKITSRTNSGCCIVKAPDWKVVLYRLDDKTQWSTSLDQFYSLNSGHLNYSERRFVVLPKLKVVSTGIDHGIHYSCSFGRLDRFVWLADGLDTQPQVSDAICRYFNIPGYQSHQIVLRFGVLPPRHEEKKAGDKPAVKNGSTWEVKNMWEMDFEHRGNCKLLTMAAKKVPYNAADFELPKNLKQVKSLADVIISKNDKSEIVDFLNDLGFSPQSKEKSRAPHK